MKPTTVKRIINEIIADAGSDVNIMIETKTRIFVVNAIEGDTVEFDPADDDIMKLETSNGTKWIDMNEVANIEI